MIQNTNCLYKYSWNDQLINYTTNTKCIANFFDDCLSQYLSKNISNVMSFFFKLF